MSEVARFHWSRSILRGLGIAALIAAPAAMIVRAADSREHAAGQKQSPLHEETALHGAAAIAHADSEMAQAAHNFWAALTPEQQAKAGFELSSDERQNWHFIPKPRKGLTIKDMTPAQRDLAHALLSSGLGQHGYASAVTIMSLEQVLHDIEKGGAMVRDPELYYFSIFGKPGSEGWGWRVEGHHVSVNFTITGTQGAVAGPIFLGANPAEVKEGPRKGLRVLGHEEDLGRKLVKSLEGGERKTAIIDAKAPGDILSFNKRKAMLLDPPGLASGKMNEEQKQLLGEIIKTYAHRLRPELAEQDLARIDKAGFDKVHFAWAGGLELGQPHYYRVQGPTFLIEYDNTQNGANHVHSVWRDLEDDFGIDLLKAHYDQHPHDNAK